MRATLGAINWLVTGSGPDLAAACSLLQQQVMSSVVADMCDVNRLVSQVHEHADMVITIKHIHVDRVCFYDVVGLGLVECGRTTISGRVYYCSR